MEEGKGSRVRVESMLTVVSSTPIGPHKLHKLSAMDHAMALHTIHIIFYYRLNPFREGPMELYLDNLRVTLSEHLCKYPPATGRLGPDEEGNWEVKCNDAGMRMVRARVGVTLDEWLRSADASEERDLTVWEDMPQDPTIWSPFRIQLNEFEGGGLAIGLSFTHMHADPTSATLFFKCWADFHRGLPILHPPIFNLPAFTNHPPPNPTSKTSEYYYITKCKEAAETVSAAKMSTLTFRFSGSKIMKCLSQVHPICPEATPFDVLAALFWLRIMRFTSPTPLSICLDFRSHKTKVIPFHYFGNALHFSSLSLHAEALEEDCELGHVAGLVHKHVTGIEEGEFWSAVDWFESRKGETGKYAPPFRMYGPELTCISMEHMSCADGTTDESLMYSAMFKEDERPVHVSYHVGNAAGKGLIMVMPSPGDRLGRTVMVSLPEHQIAILSQDQAIVELDPIMLISGKR